ncbi:hypothetical protein KEM55_000459, partial [Ascosphaera atra]
MNKGQIPGFFYGNPEKKRYFPIKANHQAIGSASQYSRENVKKRKHEQHKEKQAAALTSRLRRETVRRSTCLIDHSSIEGFLLKRGVGKQTRSLPPQGDSCVGLFKTNALGSIDGYRVAKFLRDPENKNIYA